MIETIENKEEDDEQAKGGIALIKLKELVREAALLEFI